MTGEERIKVWKRTMARVGLHASTWLLVHLPYRVVRWITGVFIAIGFRFVIKQRKIAQESLRIAFGEEKDSEEIEHIAKTCFENLGKGMIELIYFMAHPEMISQKVTIEGKEHLDEALKQGKGVIGVSAHFGNFPLLLLSFAQRGYATNAIIRSTRDKKIEEYFQKLRTGLGLHTIYSHPRKQCVDTSLRVLRENQFLFIPLDQNFGSAGGVFVDFFGQKAATATGPVIFAMRTQAVLLPLFIIRENDDQHKIVIEKPLELEQCGDDKETVLVNTSKITQVIERYIRQYPQEWGWMHRRWKTKPAPASDVPASV